ncbi:MAG: hypothetical protein DMF89_20450 [Acidobacteria bacterium]|nr:MAG: hypothetical protein DMF90_05435 [Acidobacteriota bacterium]PYR46975.1 MAG: hypothetical protein DMF89_20450 [Acidobacteriota bacterium]
MEPTPFHVSVRPSRARALFCPRIARDRERQTSMASWVLDAQRRYAARDRSNVASRSQEKKNLVFD